jgi:hypothetical protein
MTTHLEDGVSLGEFEREVLDVLRWEGPICFRPGGERTFAETFGYENGRARSLVQALWFLAQRGLIDRSDIVPRVRGKGFSRRAATEIIFKAYD